MAEWLQGKRILIVDEDYLAASRLETCLLHCGALVVGPAASVDEALRFLEFEEVDAAVISRVPGSETSMRISDVLSRSAIPFVFRLREQMPQSFDRQDNLVVSHRSEARTIARLLAESAESGQDNVPESTHHVRYEVRR